MLLIVLQNSYELRPGERINRTVEGSFLFQVCSSKHIGSMHRSFLNTTCKFRLGQGTPSGLPVRRAAPTDLDIQCVSLAVALA